MQQSDLPLYPKTISIYKKILQLGIAVILLIATISFWFTSYQQTQNEISAQFKSTGENFVQQAVITVKLLLKQKDKDAVATFIDSLAQAPLVHEAHLYDQSGKLIASTEQAQSVKSLFGLEQSPAQADQFVPFIAEIHDPQLLGYLRVNLKREVLTKPLDNKVTQQAQSVNLMLILAAFSGFLLTRGLSRFGRQQLSSGRISKKIAD